MGILEMGGLLIHERESRGVEEFPIIQVDDDAGDQVEPLGTKRKFWFEDSHLGVCLFKESRPATGEDWAEKIAAELATRLGLPHALYQLASWRGRKGVVSPRFVIDEEALIHGNEVLSTLLGGQYPKQPAPSRTFFRKPQHTLERVLSLLENARIGLPEFDRPVPNMESAADAFVGYLLLDAWIGNQDRHDLNWGLILKRSPHFRLRLAPTFDHASSLGRNETDETRRKRLTTLDRGYSVEEYAKRARSALFLSADQAHPLTTHAAFKEALGRRPAAGQVWLCALQAIQEEETVDLFRRIPSGRISRDAAEFALALMRANKRLLLES